MSREKLPDRRHAENVDVRFQGMDVSVSFGWTDDWRITEVFASTRKVGTAIDTMVRDQSVLLSIALQYGATPTVLLRSLTMTEEGNPEGFAGLILRMVIDRQTTIRAELAA